MDSRGGYILKILYVEKKQAGPLGGVRQARPRDPPMPNHTLGNINIGHGLAATTATSLWLVKSQSSGPELQTLSVNLFNKTFTNKIPTDLITHFPALLLE